MENINKEELEFINKKLERSKNLKRYKEKMNDFSLAKNQKILVKKSGKVSSKDKDMVGLAQKSKNINNNLGEDTKKFVSDYKKEINNDDIDSTFDLNKVLDLINKSDLNLLAKTANDNPDMLKKGISMIKNNKSIKKTFNSTIQSGLQKLSKNCESNMSGIPEEKMNKFCQLMQDMKVDPEEFRKILQPSNEKKGKKQQKQQKQDQENENENNCDSSDLSSSSSSSSDNEEEEEELKNN